MNIRFFNALVLDLEQPLGYFEGEVCTDSESGTITYVGENRDSATGYDRTIDCEKNLLMPGFVNAHTHSGMSIFRGVKDSVDLQDWLFNNIIPLENKLTQEDVYWATMLSCLEYVSGGTTSVNDMYFFKNDMLSAFLKFGIRAKFDLLNSSESKLPEIKKFLKSIKGYDKITASSSLHSIYTTCEQNIEDAVSFAKKNNLMLTAHLSETLKEVTDCINQNQMTPPEYLESFGFLDRPCTFYHCVHVDKDDAEILANHNANIVSCPSSNLKLASGIAPLCSFKDKGLNIALGTDGAASNNSLDMFKEMFLACTLDPCQVGNVTLITAKDAIKFATQNGAKALGIDKLGEIKNGYKADVILINTKSFTFAPNNDVVSNVVFCGRPSDVKLTMCGGEILYENGVFANGINEREIIENCEKIMKRLKGDK